MTFAGAAGKGCTRELTPELVLENKSELLNRKVQGKVFQPAPNHRPETSRRPLGRGVCWAHRPGGQVRGDGGRKGTWREAPGRRIEKEAETGFQCLVCQAPVLDSVPPVVAGSQQAFLRMKET